MPISPESRYIMDGAVDFLSLMPDIACGAVLGQIDVDGVVDGLVGEPHSMFPPALTEQVLIWRNNHASPRERCSMSVVGMMDSASIMQEFLWGITGPLAEAHLIRNHGYPPSSDLRGEVIEREPIEVTIPDIQSLRLPYVVIAKIMGEKYLRNFVPLLKGQYERFLEAFADVSVAEFMDWNRYPIRKEPIVKFRIDKRLLRQKRKALRRSVKAMNSIVSPDAYRAFISKEGFLINGHLFDYRVAKTLDLMKHEPTSKHIPYHLEVLSKSGNNLGSGCVVFDASPVLDQVIALTLHVRDQEAELDLIKTVNWTVTDEGRQNALLCPPSTIPELTIDQIPPYPMIIDHINHTMQVRFYRYRKKIMDLIEPSTMRTISQLSRIPLSYLQYMRDPTPSSLDQDRPGMVGCLRLLDHAR